MIHTWFCVFIGPKYRSWSCANMRTRIYISAKKKIINYRWKYWTFTINYFLEHEWYLCPLTAVMYNIHLWWLYNMLENYKTDKLHHPCNNNTRTMQKQCFFFLKNKFQVCTLFLCVHMLCCTCLLIVVGKCKLHTVLSKIINKSDWYWQRWLCNWVTQLVRLQSFQGMLVTGVRFRLNKISSFKHATCNYPS